jgi:hypothetical protein
MFNTIVGAGAVGARAASRYGYGSGSDQKMRLLAAPAPPHCTGLKVTYFKLKRFILHGLYLYNLFHGKCV